ncbi:hypothetical protein SESBI_02718 [Sesbania bispinosa]|nr:hypothetical protein SESBI_02718 [Sesbania bispinosa]
MEQSKVSIDTRLEAVKHKSALPDLPVELVHEMMRPPLRSYDPNLIQDPTVYSSLFSHFTLPSSQLPLVFLFC